MTDPAELLASQAEEIANSDTIPVLRMAEILALWGEALTAVLNLHQPSPFNENPRYVWCITCQTSSRALWPCETYQAVTAALESSP